MLLTCFHLSVLGQTDNHQNFSVNFVSIGAGVDSRAKGQFSDFLTKFQKENKVTLEYKIQAWGREGESEYQFNLKNLKSKQRTAFRDSVYSMFKENKLVKVSDQSRSGAL